MAGASDRKARRGADLRLIFVPLQDDPLYVSGGYMVYHSANGEQPMTRTISIIVLLLASLAFAGDELRHPPARKALARAEQETRKAEQVYRQELLRIQKALVGELERAKADAMQQQLLDEANAIQAAIDAAQGEVAKLEGKPVVQTFTIDAALPRTPTIDVRSGEKISIRATGRWSHSPTDKNGYGPEGAGRAGSDLGTLQGQIGNGDPFLVGRGRDFIADADGTLYLFMRDSTPKDNQGSIQATIGKLPK